MNLQQLIYFRAVAKQEHFTKAAATLHVTQSSLSHAINDLERELGVSLFIRHSRGVSLSKHGSIYLSYVEDALGILEAGRRRIEEDINPANSIITLAYPSSLEQFISELTFRYLEIPEYKDTVFHFSMRPNTAIEANLVDGLVDVAICNTLNSPGITGTKIGRHDLVVVVPNNHRCAQRDSVSLLELADENFIMYANEFRIRKYIDLALERLEIKPKVVQETTHGALMLKSVHSGRGVALIPQPLDGPPAGLKTLLIQDTMPPWDIHMYWKPSPYLSPAVRNFIRYVKSEGMAFNRFQARTMTYSSNPNPTD
jgi:DNA-binding transcriptional LysR family regulator